MGEGLPDAVGRQPPLLCIAIRGWACSDFLWERAYLMLLEDNHRFYAERSACSDFIWHRPYLIMLEDKKGPGLLISRNLTP
jgi:hypothetical protein